MCGVSRVRWPQAHRLPFRRVSLALPAAQVCKPDDFEFDSIPTLSPELKTKERCALGARCPRNPSEPSVRQALPEEFLYKRHTRRPVSIERSSSVSCSNRMEWSTLAALCSSPAFRIPSALGGSTCLMHEATMTVVFARMRSNSAASRAYYVQAGPQAKQLKDPLPYWHCCALGWLTDPTRDLIVGVPRPGPHFQLA